MLTCEFSKLFRYFARSLNHGHTSNHTIGKTKESREKDGESVARDEGSVAWSRAKQQKWNEKKAHAGATEQLASGPLPGD